jgi:predicted nucleic acid-binding protein
MSETNISKYLRNTTAGNAEIIISGDNDSLAILKYEGAKTITPRQFREENRHKKIIPPDSIQLFE